ncbi:peroxidase 5-like [Spinacia oleracea]|uniref:peroxidase n=1 Tax=Spinacia oleracea TaxID=3562 RepID=A0ABM3RST5_SPIOL|nr:peroxidase 5-like [Spinacia oleracea]
MSSANASQRQQQCPLGDAGANIVVPMDPISPTISDTDYYRDILNSRGLFTSDQTLLSDTATANLVYHYARNPYFWGMKFADAMVRMGQIDTLTDNEGEIRRNCRVLTEHKWRRTEFETCRDLSEEPTTYDITTVAASATVQTSAVHQ